MRKEIKLLTIPTCENSALSNSLMTAPLEVAPVNNTMSPVLSVSASSLNGILLTFEAGMIPSL